MLPDPLFPALPLAPLTPADIVLVVLLAVAMPAYGLWRDRQGRDRQLMADYREAIIRLWLAAGLAVAAFVLAGRPLADLGLRIDAGWPFLAASAAAVLASVLYAAQLISLQRSPKAREQLADMLARQTAVREILPATPPERQVFRLLAVTAGITEEILYRGFLIWAFAHWMSVWLAAVAALAVFVLCHLYQRTLRALLGVALAGGVATLLVLASGSLLPAILLHAVVDLVGGEMAWLARAELRRRTAAAPPPVAQ